MAKNYDATSEALFGAELIYVEWLNKDEVGVLNLYRGREPHSLWARRKQ